MGKVKISHLTVDARGAELDMDLYVPVNVSDSDSLPCVLLAHGRGATKNVLRGIAEELSRRGFVVLNVNAYGMGLSEQPVSDEVGNGAAGFSLGGPFGMTDALAFARTLKFVDQSRIAMYAHSFGSGRISAAAIADCGYYTLNDMLINVLADEFGQTFTEAEINENADELAKARLNADQLKMYELLRAEKETFYNTRLNTIVLTGSTGGPAPATVSVAGHEVNRECQVNTTFINGMYDALGPGASWHKDGTTDILQGNKMDTWYTTTFDGAGLTEIGGLLDTSIVNNEALSSAIAERTARIACYNAESHSKNYFSSQTTGDAVRILQQTLNYNRGNLTDTATVPLDGNSSIWWLRAVFNLVAMLSMLAMILPIVCLLINSKFFAPCVAAPQKLADRKGGKLYWVFAFATVVVTILALLKANSGGPVWANPFGVRILPNTLRLVTTSAIAVWFVVWLAVGSVVILAVKMILDKKQTAMESLRALNIGLGFKNILKTILAAIIFMVAATGMLTVIERLFNQDFRFWQMMFTEMKIEHWGVALPYVIMFLFLYLILGAAINYGARTDLSDRKEMIYTVVINSAGVWLLCLFCYIIWFVNWKGTPISDFTLSYSMLLFVPVTVYISRKMYKLTNSIWLGACINSMLLSWTLVCSAGIADKYYGQNLIAILFGV